MVVPHKKSHDPQKIRRSKRSFGVQNARSAAFGWLRGNDEEFWQN